MNINKKNKNVMGNASSRLLKCTTGSFSVQLSFANKMCFGQGIQKINLILTEFFSKSGHPLDAWTPFWFKPYPVSVLRLQQVHYIHVESLNYKF